MPNYSIINISVGNKSRTVWASVIQFLKPIVLTGVVIAILQVTGLMGSLSQASQWTLLQTGFRDAGDEPDPEAPTFDYDFVIKDLEGQRVAFESFKGKVVFLNLWATWCGPCRAEMPGIQKLYEKVDHDKIIFVMLSLDDDEALPQVKRYLTARSFSFPAYLPAGNLHKQLKVPSIPTTFVISPQGKIERKEVGAMQYDTKEFKKFLEGLVE